MSVCVFERESVKEAELERDSLCVCIKERKGKRDRKKKCVMDCSKRQRERDPP